MNPNDNYDELSEFDRDFISEAMVFVPLVEKSSKRIENPRLVDAVTQAEREIKSYSRSTYKYYNCFTCWRNCTTQLWW